jgi:hypothetical protein
MCRLLCLVSRDQPQLFDYVRRAFSEEEDVEVLFDRRGPGLSSDRGHPERRVQPLAELRDLGCAFVVVTPS